jgi:putative endonuclease
MSWHVYLLSCADGTLYCGMTNDLARRLAEHNGEPAAAGARYTRSRRPVRLAACAPCADKPAALRLELAVKKRPRAAKLAYLLEQPGARTPETIQMEPIQTEPVHTETLSAEPVEGHVVQAETILTGGPQPEAVRPGRTRTKRLRQDGGRTEPGRAEPDQKTSAQDKALSAKGRAS